MAYTYPPPPVASYQPPPHDQAYSYVVVPPPASSYLPAQPPSYYPPQHPLTPPSSSQQTHSSFLRVNPVPPPQLPPITTKVSLPSFEHAFPDYDIDIPTPPPDELSAPTPSGAVQGKFAEKGESLDWFGGVATGTQTMAEKMGEMICYLWFARPKGGERTISSVSPRSTVVSSLQLAPSPTLTTFLAHVLSTTQLSQSVIVLSLHYIYRLKCLNPGIEVKPGSDMRVGLVGLILANKYLDDNTYTNRTWSEVSGVSLDEINKMEREFLKGLNWDLSLGVGSSSTPSPPSPSSSPSSSNPTTTSARWHSWLLILKGLVYAKERDRKLQHPSPRKQHTSHYPRGSIRPSTGTTSSGTKRRPVSSSSPWSYARARSISPPPRPAPPQPDDHPRFMYTLPIPVRPMLCHSTNTSPSRKRLASEWEDEWDEAAPPPPAKKRPVSMFAYPPASRPPVPVAPSPIAIERQLNSMSISSRSNSPTKLSSQPIPLPTSRPHSPPQRTTSLGESVCSEERNRLVFTASRPPERLFFWSAAAEQNHRPHPPARQQQNHIPSHHVVAIPKAKLKYAAPPQQQPQQASPAPPAQTPAPQVAYGNNEMQHRPRLPPLQTLNFNFGPGYHHSHNSSVPLGGSGGGDYDMGELRNNKYISPLVHALRPPPAQKAWS